ncbi:MAG: NTP transferase domain-containing protein [Lachnospiraceae bacterium]|nr:NTP transferase domain-containing protein [Lachnospiraceae bacterium]
MDYIVVQAGGKGTRLKYLTQNKPKALVPVDNLPMLFHLFRKYPDKKFIIIADYKKDVMRKYLEAFAEVKYIVVEASGTGTCGGVKQAIDLLPDNEAFMLVWSDLILPADLALPEEYTNINLVPEKDYVGLSQTFPCRWKYENGKFAEERSEEFGVAGFFLFTDRLKLKGVPESGELVRWFGEQSMAFGTVGLAGTKEFGLIEEYEKLEISKCRPFNRITINGDVLTKEPVDAQGRKLAKRESSWYEKAQNLGIDILPRIYATSPLQMELIHGQNIYECDLAYDERKTILEKLVASLAKLHESDRIPSDPFSVREAYYSKTFDRLSKIRDMLPFADERCITVNGRKCRNVFFYRRELEKKLDNLINDCEEFAFIHGDCTFSNMMLRDDGEPVLIDPRGYFGFTEMYGDIRYDWAKIYYSIAGNYDRFNLKKFKLEISESGEAEVSLQIESNGWEDLADYFLELTGCDSYEIKLLHAVIWLSLTTYAWQDYDSVCGAFYNGLYYLEEVL